MSSYLKLCFNSVSDSVHIYGMKASLFKEFMKKEAKNFSISYVI